MGYVANDIQFSDDALGVGRALRIETQAGFKATFSQDSDNADITIVTYEPGETDPVDRVVKTSSFTVGALGDIQAPLYIIDATAGSIVITMSPTALNDKRYSFIRIDNTSYSVTFQGYIGTETFNWPGVLRYGDSVTLVTDYTDWFNISQLISYGTYTPVVTLNGAGTVPQYSTASGTWTIMGRICWVDIYLTGDGGNEGSGAGQILISTPHVIGASQLPVNIMAGSSINGVSENLLYATLTSGLQTIALQSQKSATQIGIFTGADQNNTTRSIRLSIKILLN